MQKLSLLLVPALLLSSSVLAVAEEKKGTVTLELKNFFGLYRTGQPKPPADELCKKKFGDLAGPAKTTYDINTTTNMMSAETNFHAAAYQLKPLGIAGQYAFGHYQNPKEHNPPIYGVLFNISLEFTNPRSSVILQLDEETNCLLTSANKPLEADSMKQ